MCHLSWTWLGAQVCCWCISIILCWGILLNYLKLLCLVMFLNLLVWVIFRSYLHVGITFRIYVLLGSTYQRTSYSLIIIWQRYLMHYHTQSHALLYFSIRLTINLVEAMSISASFHYDMSLIADHHSFGATKTWVTAVNIQLARFMKSPRKQPMLREKVLLHKMNEVLLELLIYHSSRVCATLQFANYLICS